MRRSMKKVLITGGNKGIGLATTKLFLGNNFHVIVVARDFTDFKLENQNLEKVKFDLRENGKIKDLVKQIDAVDILINNAGIMNSLPFDNYPEDKITDVININLKAPVALITEFSKLMIKNGGGRIVSVASIAGQIGSPDIWYGMTKAGVINFTKSFAKILGPKGIVINCVAPGPVENTQLFNQILEERKIVLKKASLLNRFARPDEIAKTVYWLAVDAPEYINGFCVDVNNGQYFR